MTCHVAESYFAHADAQFEQSIARTIMKVMASVRRICRNCKIIRRNGVVRVICTDPRHKQRQG